VSRGLILAMTKRREREGETSSLEVKEGSAAWKGMIKKGGGQTETQREERKTKGQKKKGMARVGKWTVPLLPGSSFDSPSHTLSLRPPFLPPPPPVHVILQRLCDTMAAPSLVPSLPSSLPHSSDLAKQRHHDLLSSASTSSSRCTSCPISLLPIEIAYLVLCYLPYRSLVAMSRVDRYWRHLTFQQDSILWYRLCQRHDFFPPIPSSAPSHYRWTPKEAIDHRPGLTRALLQSRKRLVLDGLVPNTPPLDQGSSQEPPSYLHPSSRQWYGRIDSWRDYFEIQLILEREWMEGQPVIKELRGHDEAVLCVKSLPPWERIVSGDRLGYLKVWCAMTGKCLKTIKQHMMGISCFVAQDDLLVSGSWVGEEEHRSLVQETKRQHSHALTLFCSW